MNVETRISTIKKYGYCYNCLAISHSYKNCVSKFSCRKCHKKHNTLIHRESSLRPESTPEIPNVTSSNHENASSTALPTQSTNTNRQAYTTTIQSTISSTQDPPNPSRKQILLGTAMVQIEHNGQRYSARALIDSGSEATFISRRLQRSLDIPTHSVSAQVTGLNNAVSATPTNICEITLCSPLNTNYKLSAQAFILNSLTDNLPSYPIDPKQCLKNLGFPLADTQFHKPRPVDILIGSDIYPSILLNGVKRNILGSLLAQETEFGWILSGPITQPSQNSAIVSFHNKVNPESLLTRFWEVEEIPKESVVSKSDQICEEIFQKTTRRNPDGRYIVTLPFKEPDNIDIGQSRHIALAQFLRNERALLKKPEVKAEYDKAIMEYLELGQMKKVEYDPSGKATQYYLPHHAVIKPDRITTKLRVVFNASCPTSNHKSLNDVLHIGPTLQKDLVILITNWRLFQFVFNADIQKMYRQILVDPKHTRFQRILFRKSPEDTIEDFELQTVTFGINCAPYLAIRTLMKLADDIEETHPLAAKILRQEMYVDDVLAGTHNLTTAKSARDELISALKTPGFALGKWTSNDPHILKGLPQDHLLETETLNLSEPENTKTLGIRWNSKKDSFFFLVNPMEKKPAYTKREVLSAIAKLFDPAGWLSPIIITAKIIMQQIWLDKTDWDESLKPLTLHRWNSFVKDYDNINKIEIPSEMAPTITNSPKPRSMSPTITNSPKPRRMSSAISNRSRSATRSITPISEDETISRRIQRFKSTLPTIRDEKECDDRTTRKTISHRRKHTSSRHVACGICKKDHRLVTCATYSAYNINKKYEALHKLPKKPYERDLSDDVQMRFEHLVLADPQFHSNREITLEIGADVYPQIIRNGLFKPDNGTVVAQNTAFGWTLTGTI
ncbi:uncharacterized protein LOC125780108 [Bactrocera dorsalis]|uniref:Uncharacterized protein LOC125780108 n=1 Tax=Bactrocera dorsalis TaxID=27457 RepID=A0ABM3K888_BACDO|nr:uncharacterized protein LOC125780108 [Bactrocera dorsalis]